MPHQQVADRAIRLEVKGQQASRGKDAAWQERRNTAARPVDWRFTTQDARIKLKRLYPSFQE